MEIEKERNRNSLERITFHLDQAVRFCNQLDLSELGPPEQSQWNDKMKICKDAITNQSIIVWTLKIKSLVSSLYKREELPLFGKLILTHNLGCWIQEGKKDGS
jgi:hypothetical protein